MADQLLDVYGSEMAVRKGLCQVEYRLVNGARVIAQEVVRPGRTPISNFPDMFLIGQTTSGDFVRHICGSARNCDVWRESIERLVRAPAPGPEGAGA